MHSPQPRHKVASILTWVVLIVASIGTYFIVSDLNESGDEYLRTQAEIQKNMYSGSVGMVQLPGSDIKLNIPTWSVFQVGDIWALISRSNPLPESYVPSDLVESPVPHGDRELPMKISARIEEPLSELVAAATADGYELVLSSAYRSIAEQEALMSQFTAEQGEALARAYVAEPGSSEHHSGLAIDFSDASAACLADSDDCNLSPASAQWLADNAWRFGFIQRYPQGTTSITGISYEPWHYRYVGVALSRAMHDSHLTFDEFVELVR